MDAILGIEWFLISAGIVITLLIILVICLAIARAEPVRVNSRKHLEDRLHHTKYDTREE